MVRRGLAVALVNVLAGCLGGADATTCVDGVVCPARQACAPAGGACVDVDQLAACAGLADGAACALAGIGAGTCVDSVCTLTGCGDGGLDGGEACDDGNTTSGDGCRGDCGKLEACGDAVVDAGEACDDGNGNAVDGCDACVATSWTASLAIGGEVVATSRGLQPAGVAVDGRGTIYVTESAANRVLRIDGATGSVTTLAGTGEFASAGDGGPATSAALAAPGGIVVDGLGNVYVAEFFGHRVRRIDGSRGTITTLAGTGPVGIGTGGGYGGDGGPATAARLHGPTAVAVDGQGDVYIADASNYRIRRVAAATGLITTYGGGGGQGFGGDGGPAVGARLDLVSALAIAPTGELYVADTYNHRIRRIDGAGTISTVAGTGAVTPDGDGGLALAAGLGRIGGLALDAAGDLWAADHGANQVRKIDAATGVISAVVGTGAEGGTGDGGAAAAATLRGPSALAASAAGDLYVVDGDNLRVRRVDAVTGVIDTVGGDGTALTVGDGSAATSAAVVYVGGVASATPDALYVADTFGYRIQRVDRATGLITRAAGTGVAGFSGDGGLATEAEIGSVDELTADLNGNLYLRDHPRLRRVDGQTGLITTIAGNGTVGGGGDGGAALDAELAGPGGLAVDASGNVYLAEVSLARIRRVDAATGIITSIAGTGDVGFGGDGGLATAAQLASPSAVSVDAVGNVYIADSDNHRIRKIAQATGIITTVAGDGTFGFAGDGGPATAAALATPRGVAVAADGTIYIADHSNHRLRRVDASTGIITTLAGTGVAGVAGDGGPALAAHFDHPNDVTFDGVATLFARSYFDGRVRGIELGTGRVSTVFGPVDPVGMGARAQARLASATGLARAPAFTLVAGGASGTVQALRPDELEVVAGRYRQPTAVGELARFRGAAFGEVGGVAYDAAADVIYVTETTAHRLHAVRVVDPADATTWTIATLAGDGVAGFADGSATSARFRSPAGLFFDAAARELLVADAGNHVIRALDVDGGTVTTVAGTPATLGYFGDGLAATDGLLYAPAAVTRCASGDVFIADTGNHRVRRVAAGSGLLSTVLGVGVAASSGEGAPATAFPVDAPAGLACDAPGNLLVTSTTAVRLLPAAIAVGATTGVVDGDGAVQTIFGAAPRDTFPASVTRCLTGLMVVDDAAVQVADGCTGLLLELRRAPRP